MFLRGEKGVLPLFAVWFLFLSFCLKIAHLLTYSMVQSPSWEANWFAASQEIPRILWNPKVHYRTHKPPPPVPMLGQPNPVHIPTSHLLEIQPNIIHPSTPRSPQWSPSLRFPHHNPIHPPLHTQSCMVFKRVGGGTTTHHWYEILLQITGAWRKHGKTIHCENALQEIVQEINSPKVIAGEVQMKKQFALGMLSSLSEVQKCESGAGWHDARSSCDETSFGPKQAHSFRPGLCIPWIPVSTMSLFLDNIHRFNNHNQ